jgi:hypothetical protein
MLVKAISGSNLRKRSTGIEILRGSAAMKNRNVNTDKKKA